MMNHLQSNSSSSERPTLLRSPPSIQLTPYTAHAHQQQQVNSIAEEDSHNKKQSRTQYKMMLQRQSFLADDKNYIDHPDNMRRLTKELERVNREYRCLKQYQDPFALSIQRVLLLSQPTTTTIDFTSSSTNHIHISSSSVASSISSNHSQSPPNHHRLLQRRASSNTVHDYLLTFKEERRHSFSFNRLFSTSSSTTTTSLKQVI